MRAWNHRQGWGQIRFIKYKYKYKYNFFRDSNTNTNTITKIWSNANTNTVHQIQIQIHIEAETKLTPFCRRHIKIHSIVRKLFYLLNQNFTETCFQRPNQLLACIGSDNSLATSHYWHQWWPSLLMHKWITPPKWVNVNCWLVFECDINPSLELTQSSLLKQQLF